MSDNTIDYQRQPPRKHRPSMNNNDQKIIRRLSTSNGNVVKRSSRFTLLVYRSMIVRNIVHH